jgi:hypothetical protein
VAAVLTPYRLCRILLRPYHPPGGRMPPSGARRVPRYDLATQLSVRWAHILQGADPWIPQCPETKDQRYSCTAVRRSRTYGRVTGSRATTVQRHVPASDAHRKHTLSSEPPALLCRTIIQPQPHEMPNLREVKCVLVHHVQTTHSP